MAQKGWAAYLPRVLAALSLVLWLVSLTQTAFYFDPVSVPGEGMRTENPYLGWYVLASGTILGWIMVGGKLGYVAAYANYFWMAALALCLVKGRLRFWVVLLHGVMWGMALMTFTLDKVLAGGGYVYPPELPPHYGLGLHLWFASFALVSLAEFLVLLRRGSDGIGEDV